MSLGSSARQNTELQARVQQQEDAQQEGRVLGGRTEGRGPQVHGCTKNWNLHCLQSWVLAPKVNLLPSWKAVRTEAEAVPGAAGRSHGGEHDTGVPASSTDFREEEGSEVRAAHGISWVLTPTPEYPLCSCPAAPILSSLSGVNALTPRGHVPEGLSLPCCHCQFLIFYIQTIIYLAVLAVS